MIDTPPPLAGVIGWPISHSLSPKLHGFWLKKYGINGYYIPIGLKPKDLEEGIKSLQTLGFKGFNVTIPHKESILSFADNISDRAALIGAANTVILLDDGTISVDNTDGYGFLENIKARLEGWSPKEKCVLVLGAGGAARAIISTLLTGGAEKIYVANRTRQRAEILREHMGARLEVLDWNRLADAVSNTDLVVNTTALGMVGNPPLAINLDAAASSTVVVDIVYNPLETDLLKNAQARGMIAIDGLGMLLHQAVPGFHSWFNVRPEVDLDLRAAVLL